MLINALIQGCWWVIMAHAVKFTSLIVHVYKVCSQAHKHANSKMLIKRFLSYNCYRPSIVCPCIIWELSIHGIRGKVRNFLFFYITSCLRTWTKRWMEERETWFGLFYLAIYKAILIFINFWQLCQRCVTYGSIKFNFWCRFWTRHA